VKICLIGPTYPFRGGIAHHTTLLYRTLRKEHTVTFYAFQRQYPRWMFPGKTDVDTSAIAIREEGVENILDSLNPISWWSVFRKIRRDDPDLVIIPWWVSFWTPPFWTISSLLRTFTRSRILFICHNVVAHESRFMDNLCTKSVLRKGDYYLVHSDDDFKNLKGILPRANVKKTYHPSYDVFNYQDTSKDATRQQLGLAGRVLLFFGFVRPYKGLKYVIEALPLIRERLAVTLLVVGEFWEKKEPYLRRIDELKVQDSVRIVDDYIPNEKVQTYFGASDVVILPYVSGTGSGIVQMAYGFNKPVIATRVGSLPDVVQDGVTGFLVEPGSAEAIADAVIRFYEENRETNFIQHITEEREKYSWDRMVEVIESFVTSSESYER
jgi:glycosyltransferase involved in cell wall biosynthesis